MGSNLVLLEGDSNEGDFNEFIDEARDWLYQWFKWIRPWKPTDVDPERVTWLRCYDIPAHAWNSIFFSRLTAYVGEFVCANEYTERKRSLDVARLMVRTQSTEMVNRMFKVAINNIPYSIKVVEDWSGPLQWRDKGRREEDSKDNLSSSEDEFSDHGFSGNDGDDDFSEDKLNALLNIVRNSRRTVKESVVNNSNPEVNDSIDGALMAQGGQNSLIGESPTSSAGSFVEE